MAIVALMVIGHILWPFCHSHSQSMNNRMATPIDLQLNGRERSFWEISSTSHVIHKKTIAKSSNQTWRDPSQAYVSIYVRSINLFKAELMEYEADLYLQLQWFDFRLKKDKRSKAINYHDRKRIQRVWKPDIVFTNAKESQFLYVTVPNVFMRIEPNGNVLYILR